MQDIDVTHSPANQARREFVVHVVAGGFALGFAPAAWSAARATPATGPTQAFSAPQAGAASVTDWVRITGDDVVTLVVSQAEMGQGISTTLPAVLCDELGADWSRVRLELAPTAEAYRNPRVNWQFTGNSESIQSFAQHMRKVGATARAMLVRAAAARWKVSNKECTTRDGRILHQPSRRALRFGDVAESAAKIEPPANAPLRSDSELRLLGRSVPRVDVPQKTDGSALFGIDYVPRGLEGVVFAAIRTAPAYGGKPIAVKNRDAVRARLGVIDIVMLPTAVAVVASKYWQARAALAIADIEFDAGPNPSLSSDSLRALYADKMANGPFVVAKEIGTADTGASRDRVEATYELPFQCHAPLEPMNALARVTASGADIWAPTQGQELTKYAVAGVLQIDPKNVHVYRSPYLGGGFGRRLLPDFCIDAALLSKAVGKPVKVIWSREEDMRRDYFRPATLHRIHAELSSDGYPVALRHRLVSPTILKPVFPTLDMSSGIDPSALEGTLHTHYRIPHWRTEFHLLDIPVPTSVYRTTGYGPTIFGLESFIDELAHRSRRDPLRFRRELLAHEPRASRVLDEVARRSRWSSALSKDRGRGVAFTDAFGTLLAQVVEISVKGDAVKVDRVFTVADPGRVFDPKIADAGIEGGAIWGLSSAVKQEITFAKGGPVQTNFHEYDFVRMHETPKFGTVLIESPGAPIGGIGEVGPVATVPALANAIFSATGKRIRTLPLARSALAFA